MKRIQRYAGSAADGSVCVVPRGMSSPPVQLEGENRKWTCPACYQRNLEEFTDCVWCQTDKPQDEAA